MVELKVPIEILPIKDPNGNRRVKVVVPLKDIFVNPSIESQLKDIENDYLRFINNCREILQKIDSNKKNKGDPLLKWTLADIIYRFLKDLEKRQYVFANMGEALSRDLKISRRYLNYLIKFRTAYKKRNLIKKEINWDKYKELLDIADPSLRKTCMNQILAGKLKTREDIRAFKKGMKRQVKKR